MSDEITIGPPPSPLPADMQRRIDEIFFASSLRQTFADAAERAAFHERWLGRYLKHATPHTRVARSQEGDVIGYIVGALDDPARNPDYADVGYFAALADVTPNYPAHLHINVLPGWRSHGVGARLIDAFCAHAEGHGVAGVHLVTGAASRNRAFYARNGFSAVRELDWNGTRIVMLGRILHRPA